MLCNVCRRDALKPFDMRRFFEFALVTIYCDARALTIPDGVTYRDLLTKRDYSGMLPLDEFGVVLLEG